MKGRPGRGFGYLPVADRIEVFSVPEPNSGCVLWLGTVNVNYGYGVIVIDGRKRHAHRIAYELRNGRVSRAMTLDHLCRTRICINPDHLEVVTRAENVLRGVGVAAANARKTHCGRGHAFDVVNTYVRPDGGRDCRTCKAEAFRRFRERRRANGTSQSIRRSVAHGTD